MGRSDLPGQPHSEGLGVGEPDNIQHALDVRVELESEYILVETSRATHGFVCAKMCTPAVAPAGRPAGPFAFWGHGCLTDCLTRVASFSLLTGTAHTLLGVEKGKI